MNVVMLGPPGAGKGTQAVRIAQRRGLAHLSSGDILRSEVKDGTELGRKARSYMESGGLVPDDLIIAMMVGRIEKAGGQGFLLDGFPRTLAQARQLDERLASLRRQVDRVIHLVVSDDELLNRLTGRWTCTKCSAVYHQRNSPPARAGICDACGGELTQRPDDRAEVVANRLRTYHEQTRPLVDYYRGRGVLVDVDGQAGMDEVTRAIESLCELGA